MKKTYSILTILLVLSFSQNTEAQLWKKLKKKVENKIERKVDKEIDDVFDPKKKEKEDEAKKKKKEKEIEGSTVPNPSDKNGKHKGVTTPDDLWTNYDFVPADHVIFYDNFKFDEYGAFPAKWNLMTGNAEVVRLNSEKVFLLKGGNNNRSMVSPLLINFDFMERTTIEFDIYCPTEFWDAVYNTYTIRLWENAKRYSSYKPTTTRSKIHKIEIDGRDKEVQVSMGTFGQKVSLKTLDYQLGWHHISIVVDGKSLQFYFDKQKMLNIPDLGDTPTGMSISGFLRYSDDVLALKNIKIAKGGTSLYKRIISDGRFVTNGILFDIGKASLKPQSGGVLKRVLDMLLDNPEWKFEIVGHTDSDGETKNNLVLSKKRAKSVKQALVDSGIDASRLTTVGKGENEPLNSNTTPEEKANNRRVAFILKK